MRSSCVLRTLNAINRKTGASFSVSGKAVFTLKRQRDGQGEAVHVWITARARGVPHRWEQSRAVRRGRPGSWSQGQTCACVFCFNRETALDWLHHKNSLYFSFLIVSMYLMELYLQCLAFFFFFLLFFFFFVFVFFFRIHDFKKPYITSFNNNKKKALIEKGRPKVCRPRLIAKNRSRWTKTARTEGGGTTRVLRSHTPTSCNNSDYRDQGDAKKGGNKRKP